MKYRVSWRPEAQAAATTIWLGTRLRNAVSEAMAQIDAALSVNPAAIGESRSDLLRVATFRPLTVWFRVIETDRRVVIMSVNLINPPGPRF